MKTWLNVFLTLQAIMFVCILGFALWGVYEEYKNKWKKKKSLLHSIKVVFTDTTLYKLWGIGIIIMFALSILFTKLILIFNFLEKL